MSRLLTAIGVHPDDLVVAVAGTIRAYACAGWRIRCVVLTRGEAGGPPDVRMQETRRALGLLGVTEKDIIFGDFPDTGLVHDHAVIQFLEDASGQPDMALIPSIYDAHQDHVAASLAGRSAFRNTPDVLMYETPSSTVDFRPEVFVDITRHLRAKVGAIRCHRTQRGHRYMSPHHVRCLAEVHGFQARVPYAETFMPLRATLRVAETRGDRDRRNHFVESQSPGSGSLDGYAETDATVTGL